MGDPLDVPSKLLWDSITLNYLLSGSHQCKCDVLKRLKYMNHVFFLFLLNGKEKVKKVELSVFEKIIDEY